DKGTPSADWHWACPAQLELVGTSRGGVRCLTGVRQRHTFSGLALSSCDPHQTTTGVRRAQVTPSWSSSDYQERSVSQSEKRSKVRLNRGAQSPCQALMELLHYQMRQVNVSLKRSEVCLNRVRRAQVTPSWSSSDYQERSVSQSEKRSKVRINRGAQSPGDP